MKLISDHLFADSEIQRILTQDLEPIMKVDDSQNGLH